MSEIDELEPVAQNLYGVAQIERPRPYVSSAEEMNKWLGFNSLERKVLNGRVKELTGRFEQIRFIYECRKSESYLVNMPYDYYTHRNKDLFFYEWLEELFTEGVPYGAHRQTSRGIVWAWDEIGKTIDICLSKGLSLDESCKVAVVGVKALKRYLDYGIISVQGDVNEEKPEVAQLPDQVEMPKAQETVLSKYSTEEQASLLRELASAASSRGATMAAKLHTPGMQWAGMTNFWQEKENPYPDKINYAVEYKLVTNGGEITPYAGNLLFEKDTPPEIVKWVLGKLNAEKANAIF